MFLFGTQHLRHGPMYCGNERSYGTIRKIWPTAAVFSQRVLRYISVWMNRRRTNLYCRLTTGHTARNDFWTFKRLAKTFLAVLLIAQLFILLLSSGGAPDGEITGFADRPGSVLIDRLSKDYPARATVGKRLPSNGRFAERKISSIRDDQDGNDRKPFSSSISSSDKTRGRHKKRSHRSSYELSETDQSNIVDDAPVTAHPLKAVEPTLAPPIRSDSRSQTDESLFSTKPLCPINPPDLQGELHVVTNTTPPTIAETASNNVDLQLGGSYHPTDCIPRYRVAFIIPHRAREMHLRSLMSHLHPILQRQLLHYKVYVVHQSGNLAFNKAKLMNIGAQEAMKDGEYDCFVFHDVDLLLEDDRLLYACTEMPKHLSVAIDKYSYVLPYNTLFGGVTMISPEQFRDVNGFSNLYWGWGGEDDDMFNRLFMKGYTITRPSVDVARYKMSFHKRDEGNKLNLIRFEVLAGSEQRLHEDGFNSVKYSILSVEPNPVYTNITVDVGTAIIQCRPSLDRWSCSLVLWLCEKFIMLCDKLQYNSTDDGTLSSDYLTMT